jgi:hypothetical protein
MGTIRFIAVVRSRVTRFAVVVATVAAAGCGSGDPVAIETSTAHAGIAESSIQVEALPSSTTAPPDTVRTEPDLPPIVEFDETVFPSGWTVNDEAVQAFAAEVDMEPEDAIRILQFQSAASQVVGDLDQVFGDRFILSAFAVAEPELTIFVTRAEPADTEWLNAVNAQPTGGRFFIVEDPELADERAARCPTFGTVLVPAPALEFTVSVDSETVVAGESFRGHVSAYNPTDTDISFGGFPSFEGVLLAPGTNDPVTFMVNQEHETTRSWIVGPGETVEIPFTAGTEPCGYQAPNPLPSGHYDVGVAWAWGLLGPTTVEVVAP